MHPPRDKGKGGGRDRVALFLLFMLAALLIVQILLSWAWGYFDRHAGRMITVAAGSKDLTVTAGGILTFAEELVLAPQSGMVRFHVIDGERVPVGKKIAEIVPDVPDDTDNRPGQAQRNGNPLQSIRALLQQNGAEADSLPTESLPAPHGSYALTSHRAGLVSMRLDGWEMFGPETSFIYLSEEEYQQKTPVVQLLATGEKVSRMMPVLRILDNYCWWFSTILPSEPGRTIAEKDHVEIIFSFAPGQPVSAEKVETRERDDGYLEFTFQIKEAVGDFYNHRWCTAEIIHDRLEGAMIPRDVLLEIDGSTGVYILRDGTVEFQEVQLLADKNEYLLVEGINPNEQVIARPGRVEAGRRFLW